MFQKATKKKSKLRLLIEGFSGSGKTYSALLLASAFGGKVAVIDTEKGSASLYADKFDFDVCELHPPYAPENYIKAIKEAESAGYDVIIIDSLTHEWNGQGGCLDLVDKLNAGFRGWAKITPRHNAFVEAILQSSCHIIGTARAKSDYSMEQDGNKFKVRKVGTKTEQREGLDFEFTTVFRLNQNHLYEVTKDRTGLFMGKQATITQETAKELIAWLNAGEEASVETRHREPEIISVPCGDKTDLLTKLNDLIVEKKVTMETRAKWLEKAAVDKLDGLSELQLAKCIEMLEQKL